MTRKGNGTEARIPYVIYHYCSLDTFNSIITNKTLRLSDITKSNDSMELIYLKDRIKGVFTDAYEFEGVKFFKDVIDRAHWNSLVDHYISDWFDESHRDNSCYVLCFSGKNDLLSQWRGYANDGKGVSIGIDSRILRKIISGRESVLSLKPVLYNKRSQKRIIRSYADGTISALKKRIRDNQQNGKDELLPEPEAMKCFNTAFNQLFDLASYSKDPFFKEENEYRLIYRVDSYTLFTKGREDADETATKTGKDILDVVSEYKEFEVPVNDYASFKPFKFFAKDNSISSYTDLHFDKAVKARLPLIRSVTAGPKCNVTPDELAFLLFSNGIDLRYNEVNGIDGVKGPIDVEVKKSVGSYR